MDNEQIHVSKRNVLEKKKSPKCQIFFYFEKFLYDMYLMMI